MSEQRTTMNGKQVFTEASRVINFKSGFAHKLLCDGPTFTTGTACAYSCSFCYVPDIMRKTAKSHDGHKHEDIVIRRENPIAVLRGQLTDSKGRPKFNNPKDQRVIYASPLVDVAANMELVRETVEACKVILELTNWDIRLLSKSNLLPKVAQTLMDWFATETSPVLKPEKRLVMRGHPGERIIYGVSTGTLDDKIASAFEEGTPLVSKRIQSLHWLQDNGFRTFGMICPSLPLFPDTEEHYEFFARSMYHAIRGDRCEHVWAEIINVRGDSFTRTVKCLHDAKFFEEASMLSLVGSNKTEWEAYARKTFLAHAPFYKPGQLRFLQYVTKDTRPFWEAQKENGAILL